MENNTLTSNPKRPVGISIISSLFLLGGGLSITFFFIDTTEFSLPMILSLFMIIVIIVAAFGLSMGKKWGWWVISIMSIVNVLSELEIIFNVSEATLLKEPNFYLQYFSALVFHLLILLYLFQKNVFKYFIFMTNTVLNKFGIVMLISLGIYTRDLCTTRGTCKKVNKNPTHR